MSTFPLQWGSGGWGAPGSTWGIAPLQSLPAAYYLGLFTSEYQLSTNLLAVTSVLLKPLQDMNLVWNLMASTSFDLQWAEGVQLDGIGEIIGVSREVSFQPSNNVSPILNDATYRLLLQATLYANHWDGTLSSLIAIWNSLFPGGSIAVDDGFNMTATIFISGAFSSIIVDLLNNGYLIPRPQTVMYTIVLNTTLPLFGFGENDGYIAGCGVGHFAGSGTHP